MYFAVLTFKYLKNRPHNVPENFPAEVRGLGNSTTLPSGEGWVLMTGEELQDLLTFEQTTFDKWKAEEQTKTAYNLHYIEEFVSGLKSKASWYKTKDQDGNYIDKVRDIVYIYEDNVLLSAIESVYSLDGYATVTKTIDYKTDSSEATKKYIEEIN